MKACACRSEEYGFFQCEQCAADPLLNAQTGHDVECLQPRVITRVMDDGIKTKDGAA